MNWFLFAVGVASIFPLTGWIRQNERRLELIWMVIGALPFVWGAFPKRKLVVLGVPEWPGFTQGFDVSLLDLLLVAAFLSLPRRPRVALPFKLSFTFYIGAVLVSAFQAQNPTATLYYTWQLLRMFMVFAIVARACLDARLTVALLKGLAIGVCLQGLVVGWQRFIVHYVQARGTFTAQNMLGMTMHFVIYPFFALLLSGGKSWHAALVPVIGVMIAIFTTSRATVGFSVLGFSLVFALSMLRKWTPRMTRILGAAVLAIAVVSPIAYRQFEYRFQRGGITEEEGGRSTLNDAAQMILIDHPMGIGANNYVVFANEQGYSERANVSRQNKGAYPHNIYWTTAAEVGYVGLLAFGFFLLRPLLFALSRGWRSRNDQRGDVLLGLAVSLIVVYSHSYFEKNFFYDEVQYMFAIDLGLIAGLAGQLTLGSALGSRNSLVQSNSKD